jgi:uncharacterized protein YecE (DUF72 family)
MQSLFIGTAGWSLPKQHAAEFSSIGTHLQRYAKTFNCAEINSSFYRPHRPSTWARWASSVPPNFRFSVKVPRAITHESGLVCPNEQLRAFLEQITALGDRLGPLLIQLPPKQAFEEPTALRFLESFRAEFPSGPIVLEPRHPSWFSPGVSAALERLYISRVAADPAALDEGRVPAGDLSVAYFRLHGSPRTYYSSYDDASLDRIADSIRGLLSSSVYCIFDNTAHGHATGNALEIARITRLLAQ